MTRVGKQLRESLTLAARTGALWLLTAIASACVFVTALIGPHAFAQDPSLSGGSTKTPSAFQKQPGGPIGPVQKVDGAQPLFLQGDELIYDSRGSSVTAKGNVEIYFNNYILTADQVIYDQAANTLTAMGNVTLKEPNGQIVRAERLTLTDDFRDGFIQQLSIQARDDTRIAAQTANRRDGNVTEFEKGKFTPCKSDPGKPPLWCISATRIIHDQRAATITYNDAQFELFGVPILYLPFFQHADPSVKRKSGFLLPEYGSSTQLGFMIEVPYYFALAPNYDLTFHPRYMSKQGVLYQADWRHKLRLGDVTGSYDVKVSGIDDGDSRDFRDASGNVVARESDWSGSVQTRGRFSLSSWWHFGWDITLESDDAFRRFYKLDNILQTDRVNTVYLRGLSERNYLSITGYQFGGLLLSSTPDTESRVHPVVDWNYVLDRPVPVIGGEVSWNFNALSFSRSEGSKDARQTSNINRASADINWRRKLTDAVGIQYTPFAQARGDIAQYSDVIDPVSGLAVNDADIQRGLASAGVLASYPWIAHTAAASHVVEPIAQIIGRTARLDQRNLPDEDARSLVFDDTNLFEIDKFSGWDRIETGTRVNVGGQYTFQANGGGFARVLAGQSFHLSGDNIFSRPGQVNPSDAGSDFLFSPSSGLATNQSDYVLAGYIAPSSAFRILGQSRFNEDDFSLRRADIMAFGSYGPVFASAIYAFSATDRTPAGVARARARATAANTAFVPADDQQDIFGVIGLRLTDNWSLQAMLRYDLDSRARIQDQLQLRYTDECFVLTATYTETFIENAARDLTNDRTLMLRFELKHLGAFAYKTDSLDHFWAENQPPG